MRKGLEGLGNTHSPEGALQPRRCRASATGQLWGCSNSCYKARGLVKGRLPMYAG